MKKIVLTTLSLLFMLTACNVKEDLDDCPGGETRIQVYVEKFQSEEDGSMPANSEAQFNTRINDLTFYLYKGDDLVEQGELDVTGVTAQTYSFAYPSLSYGDYTLVLLGNTSNNRPALRSIPDTDLVYPGYAKTEDYFRDSFDFTVEDKEVHTYTTQLKRVQGLVRFNFLNLPDYVTAIDVTLDELSSHSHRDGSYTDEYTFSRHLAESVLVRDAENAHSFTVMTYPTLDGEKSSWRVKVYRDGSDVPYYDRIVMTDLHVLRNQLLDLTVEFPDDPDDPDPTPDPDPDPEDINFYVGLNNEWDGQNLVEVPVEGPEVWQ